MSQNTDGDLDQGAFIKSCEDDAQQDNLRSWDRSLAMAFGDLDRERAHTRIPLSDGFHAEPGRTLGHLHDVYAMVDVGENERVWSGMLTKGAVDAWAGVSKTPDCLHPAPLEDPTGVSASVFWDRVIGHGEYKPAVLKHLRHLHSSVVKDEFEKVRGPSAADVIVGLIFHDMITANNAAHAWAEVRRLRDMLAASVPISADRSCVFIDGPGDVFLDWDRQLPISQLPPTAPLKDI